MPHGQNEGTKIDLVSNGRGAHNVFFIGDFTDSRAIKMTFILLRFVMQESVPAGLGRNPLLRAALRQKQPACT